MEDATRYRSYWIALTLAALTASAVGQDVHLGSGLLPDGLEATPNSELELLLAPLGVDELTVLSEEAMADLRKLGHDLAKALIQQQRARESKEDAAESKGDADARVRELLTRKETLVSRIEIVLKALEAKGADVKSSRLYVGVIHKLEPHDSPSSGPVVKQSEKEQAQAALNKAVKEAVAAVREEPPVHERQKAWTVPISELELELQPLRVAQVKERIDKWLDILQREVRRRIRIDIALTRAEDGAQQKELASRSAAQQAVIQAVVNRVEVALRILQKRGGDVGEYKKYIATATGQQLNLTDPAVLYAQAIAWIKAADGGIKLGLNLLKVFGLLLAFYVLSRILGKIVATGMERAPKASSLLRSFLVTGVKRLTMLIGLVIAVSALGVNVTPLVAAIGATGLVVGLALQGTLSNFASGMLILFYRPFDVGDVINGGGVTGKVESMNLVSTSILTFDNQAMVVPNNQIWNGVITNVTGRNTRRVDLAFGIGYGDDIGHAVEVLEEAMSSHGKVLAKPEPVVRVHELGDNSVNLIARPWARTSDYWDVYWDLTREVKERFDAAGLNIPFPQRDLHIPGTIEVKLANGSNQASSHESAQRPRTALTQPSIHEPAPGGGSEDND